MNLAAAAPLWLYLLLAACLGAAAVEDAVRLRIANFTCGAIALLAMIAFMVTGPHWSIWENLLVFIGVLIVGTFAFSAGVVGGGDVKLLAAVGLWTPFKSALPLLSVIFLAGGALALAAMLAWQFRRSAPSPVKTRRIPYGVAIASGAAIVFQSART
ncbi:MAG: A24 family peptidase [Sphingomicrobium sp.]